MSYYTIGRPINGMLLVEKVGHIEGHPDAGTVVRVLKSDCEEFGAGRLLLVPNPEQPDYGIVYPGMIVATVDARETE